MEEKELDLSDILNSLKKRWKIICSITIIGVIVSLMITFCLITPKYTVSTKLFIGKENAENQLSKSESDYSSNDIQMYQKILQTYADIIETRTLISTALEKEDIDLKSTDVLENLTVTPKDDTQIIEITYEDKNPYMAKEILEAISYEFINYSNILIPNANIQVVEEIFLPEKPSSPNKPLNIAIGFVVGLILGLLTALFLDYSDNTFEDKRKLEKEIGITVIGDIPNFDILK